MSLEQKEITFLKENLNDFEIKGIKGNICFGYVEGEDIEGILDDLIQNLQIYNIVLIKKKFAILLSPYKKNYKKIYTNKKKFANLSLLNICEL